MSLSIIALTISLVTFGFNYIPITHVALTVSQLSTDLSEAPDKYGHNWINVNVTGVFVFNNSGNTPVAVTHISVITLAINNEKKLRSAAQFTADARTAEADFCQDELPDGFVMFYAPWLSFIVSGMEEPASAFANEPHSVVVKQIAFKKRHFGFNPPGALRSGMLRYLAYCLSIDVVDPMGEKTTIIMPLGEYYNCKDGWIRYLNEPISSQVEYPIEAAGLINQILWRAFIP